MPWQFIGSDGITLVNTLFAIGQAAFENLIVDAAPNLARKGVFANWIYMTHADSAL
jgi:hypothetical protein